MDKYYIPLLFLAVIALVLFSKFYRGGSLVLTQTPNQATQSATQASFPTTNDIASWKTYKNSSLMISFNYPANWDTLDRGEAGVLVGPVNVIAGIKGTVSSEGPGHDILSIYAKPPATFDMEIPQTDSFLNVSPQPAVISGNNT